MKPGAPRYALSLSVIVAVLLLRVALQPWLGLSLYVFVALMWLVPDRRIASVVGE